MNFKISLEDIDFCGFGSGLFIFFLENRVAHGLKKSHLHPPGIIMDDMNPLNDKLLHSNYFCTSACLQGVV